MGYSTAVPLPALFLAVALLHAQDSYPPTPAHRWAYDGLALAKREGLLVEYSNGHRDRRPKSRYEIVVAFHAIATDQLQRAEAFLAKPSDGVERATLIRSVALLPVYKRAEREFKREFVSLGIEDDFGQSRLAALTRQIEATAPIRDRPFRDVPADHWAAKAVGDLRALGLLDGYPDGNLRG